MFIGLARLAHVTQYIVEVPAVELSSQIHDQKPLKKADLVAEQLKWHIVLEKLSAGDKLPHEQQLTEHFKTSRWTIREALKSLEVQGLIEIVPGAKGGARVVSVPYERASNLLANFFHFEHLTGSQIYDVRNVLEPIMAQSVVGLLTEEDLKALENTITVARRYAGDDARRLKVRRAELDFHHILARACPNPFVMFICRFINDLLFHFIAFNQPMLQTHAAVSRRNLEYHQKLFDAYCGQDAPLVAALMQEHMVDIAKVMEKHQAYIEQGLIKRRSEAPSSVGLNLRGKS